jgi:hypothetical protein
MLLVIALASLIHPGPVVADGWVIKVAELEVEVPDTEVALTHLVAIAVELGGGWVSRTKWQDGPNTDATLTLAVPALAFEEALRRLCAGAATVGNQQVSTEDVSARLADLDSAIRALEKETARLRSLIEQARIATEAEAAQRELGQVEERVAELEAQRAGLAGRAAEARITLEIRQRRATPTPTRTVTPTRTATPVPPTPTPVPWDPNRTFQEARAVQRVLFQNLADAAIWFGVTCLPALAVGGLVVWLAWRWPHRSSPKEE